MVEVHQQTQEQTETDVLYCTVHPDRETVLRCNKCGRPMCNQCAVRTPVGYRCRECVKGQQAIFFTGKTSDLLIQFAVTLPLSMVASAVIGLLGRFGIFFLFLVVLPASTFAGGLIADVAHRAAGRRRGRYGWLAVGAGIVLGAVVAGLVPVILAAIYIAGLQQIPAEAVQEGTRSVPFFYSLASFTSLGWWIYIMAGTAAAIGRLRMGRITLSRRQ